MPQLGDINLPAAPPKPTATPDQDIPDRIRQEALSAGIPPELALAVAEQESSFNPLARGPALPNGERAIGIFQFLPSTASARKVNAEDPAENIKGGVAYLRELLDTHKGDLNQVLRTYGGVKTNTTYVPEVLGRLPKFAAQSTPAPGQPAAAAAPSPTTPPAEAPAPGAPPRPSLLASLTSGFDPRTRTGRRNLAGGVGAATAVIATGGTGLVPILAGVAGAGAAGAAAEGGEQVAAGETVDPWRIGGAGVEQGAMEGLGGIVAWPFKAAGRHLMAGPVGRAAKKSLSSMRTGVETQLASALTAAEQSVAAVRSRFASQAPAVYRSEAGRMATNVVKGPAKLVKDEVGESVGAAAKTGPPVSTLPIKAELDRLAESITPMASHASTVAPQMVGGRMMSAAQISQLSATQASRGGPTIGIALPAEHPLPKVLDDIRTKLADTDTISFEDAHLFKRKLDDAVNARGGWEQSARDQAGEITKALRQSFRKVMTGHAPYDVATEAYTKVARLHGATTIKKAVKEAYENPEGLIEGIQGKNPTRLRILRDLLLEEAPKTGDPAAARSGQGAWDAVRATWTYDRLIRGGPDKVLDRIEKLDPEFIEVMYGDPAGKTVLGNLTQIGQALKTAVGQQEAVETAVKAAKAPTALEKAFGESSVAHAPSTLGAIADAAYVGTSPSSPYAIRAAVRLLYGPKGSELIQWAAYSPKRTQLLVQALASPAPGLAVADVFRMSGLGNVPLEKLRPVASHETAGSPKSLPPLPPPAPRNLTPRTVPSPLPPRTLPALPR